MATSEKERAVMLAHHISASIVVDSMVHGRRLPAPFLAAACLGHVADLARKDLAYARDLIAAAEACLLEARAVVQDVAGAP